MTRAQRFGSIVSWFEENMPVAETELRYGDPFQLLVAVSLSAQCTDRRVNLVTPPLFERFPTPESLAEAGFDEVYPYVKSVSYPNAKARHLIEMARRLVADFGSEVPSDIDQLSEGDVFYLRVLDETLAYEVEAVNIVLPYETELLAPVRGRDLCTLVTCYPYGVNTHRLLVRGKRIPYEEAVEIEEIAGEEPVRSTWKEQYVKGLVIGGAAAAGAILIGLLISFILYGWSHSS